MRNICLIELTADELKTIVGGGGDQCEDATSHVDDAIASAPPPP